MKPRDTVAGSREGISLTSSALMFLYHYLLFGSVGIVSLIYMLTLLPRFNCASTEAWHETNSGCYESGEGSREKTYGILSACVQESPDAVKFYSQNPLSFSSNI